MTLTTASTPTVSEAESNKSVKVPGQRATRAFTVTGKFILGAVFVVASLFRSRG